MIRLIATGLALALVASAQAAPLARHSQRNFIVTKGQGSGGCGPYYYRGVGGKCVYYGAERPDGYYGYSYRQPYRPYKYSQP